MICRLPARRLRYQTVAKVCFVELTFGIIYKGRRAPEKGKHPYYCVVYSLAMRLKVNDERWMLSFTNVALDCA